MHGKILSATSKNDKVRKKSDPSNWTSRKSTKGVFDPEKMMHFTNLDDKNKWNTYCDLHDKTQHKLKLLTPASSQKPKLMGSRILVNFVSHGIFLL